MTPPSHTSSSREVHLASRPTGRPQASDFSIVTVAVDEPKVGEVLVENLFRGDRGDTPGSDGWRDSMERTWTR